MSIGNEFQADGAETAMPCNYHALFNWLLLVGKKQRQDAEP